MLRYINLIELIPNRPQKHLPILDEQKKQKKTCANKLESKQIFL